MRTLKVLLLFTCIFAAGISLTACHKPEAKNVVKVGIIDGPSTVMWETAQKIAQQKYGLQIQLVKFSDYNMPNEALNNGDIDANAFQHQPFLDDQIKARGYHLITIAKTFVYPIALYSQKITQLSQIKNGDRIAIPNDPSNEARALLLLEQARLIKLRDGAGISATTTDIMSNPKQLKISEIDAAQLPRVLPDVTAAVINNDFAVAAGLNAQNAVFVENADSPYMNIIVIRPDEKNDPKIAQLIAAFQTPEVKAAAIKVSHGNAIAGW